jgi:hypothetical protein
MTHTHTDSSFNQFDRRPVPQLQMVDQIHGHFIPLEVPLTVLDMTDEGFAVESPIEFTPNIEYQFELSSASCPKSLVRAIDVHCLRVVSGGRPWYVAGFLYAPDIAGIVRERIASLVRPPQDTAGLTGDPVVPTTPGSASVSATS